MTHPTPAGAACLPTATPDEPNPLLRLSQLASITPGYRLLARQMDADGDIHLLRLQDFTPASATPVTTPRARIAHPPARQMLQAGDVVLALLGQTLLAAAVPEPEQPTLCTAPLWLIRILDQASVLPAYLEWYLNTNEAQAAARRYFGQGSVRECLQEGLHNLPVRVPPLAIQQDIVALAARHAVMDALRDHQQAGQEQQREATMLAMTRVRERDVAAVLGQ
jgi:hypothetical protein